MRYALTTQSFTKYQSVSGTSLILAHHCAYNNMSRHITVPGHQQAQCWLQNTFVNISWTIKGVVFVDQMVFFKIFNQISRNITTFPVWTIIWRHPAILWHSRSHSPIHSCNQTQNGQGIGRGGACRPVTTVGAADLISCHWPMGSLPGNFRFK